MNTTHYRRLQYRRVLPLLFFLLLCTFETLACPVWKIGDVRVVDEQGKDILNAVIWQVRSEKDSFRLERGERYRYRQDTAKTDTIYFEFWNGSGFPSRAWLRQNPQSTFKPYYRVHAPGFADVVVQAFDFSLPNRSDDIVPTIKLVMYHARYLRKGDEIIRFTEYKLNKAQAVNDSTVIGLKEYTRALKQESGLQTLQRKNKMRVSSYPNPATDFIKIEIRDSMPLPYRAELHDLNGRLMEERSLTEPLNLIDLKYHTPGMYIVTVRDHKGEILYCSRFTKM